jgi:hypothetical protein
VGWTTQLDTRIFDPDNALPGAQGVNKADPNDDSADSHNPGDNYLGFNLAPNPPSNLVTMTALLGQTINLPEQQYTIDFGQYQLLSSNPGNNFIVAVGNSIPALSAVDFAKDGLTLFYPYGDARIPTPLPSENQTKLLTSWRTLWVEEDTMGTAPKQLPGADEPPFQPTRPDVGTLLADLMLPACVTVEVYPRWGVIPYQYDIGGNVYSPGPDQVALARMCRMAPPSTADFWCVQVIGVCFDSSLKASDGSNAYGGYIFGTGAAFIAEEKIFDEYARHRPDWLAQYEERIVAHEVLHAFLGDHDPNLNPNTPDDDQRGPADYGMMDPNVVIDLNAEIPKLRGDQLRKIQQNGLYY